MAAKKKATKKKVAKKKVENKTPYDRTMRGKLSRGMSATARAVKKVKKKVTTNDDVMKAQKARQKRRRDYERSQGA